MMRFAYVVSAGTFLLALAPLSAQTPAPVELTIDPWQGAGKWTPVDGTPIAVEKSPHGEASIDQDGSVVYKPTLNGDFWTVGSDRLIVTVVRSDGAVVDQRLTARASTPTSGPPTTHFEDGEPRPTEHDDEGQITVGPEGALLGAVGARIVLDGSGREAYFEYPLTVHPFRGTDNSDAGCADLRMGLDGGRNLDGCLDPGVSDSVCTFGLLSAISSTGSELFRVEVGLSQSETVLRGVAYDKWRARTETPWVTVSHRPHEIRLDWWTGDDGGLRLRIDGRVRGALRGIETTDLVVREMRVGAPVSAPGTGAALSIDAITVRQGFVAHDSGHMTADPFEEELAVWEAVGTSGGDVGVSSTAALGGDAGLEINFPPEGSDPGWGAWVLDWAPDSDVATGVRFRLNADDLEMARDETLNLVLGHQSGTGVEGRFLIGLWESAAGKRIRASAQDNHGERQTTPYAPLSDGSHIVEMTWRSASETGSADGRLRLWLDGQLTGELTDLDNETVAIESLRFGAMYLKPETRGILYLDEFESWSLDEAPALP